jgi:hypothetical protein
MLQKLKTNTNLQWDRFSGFTCGTYGRSNWPSGRQHEKKQKYFGRQNVTNTSSALLLKKETKEGTKIVRVITVKRCTDRESTQQTDNCCYGH